MTEERDPQAQPRSDGEPTPRHSRARRQLLKSLAAGGVVAGAHVVPERWVKPVVDVVVVPAHAQASGPAMNAQLTFQDGDDTITIFGPTTATLDGFLDNDEISVSGQATLINPPVPGQGVTLIFAFDPGVGDGDFNGPPQTVPSNLASGVANFSPADFDNPDTGANSNLPDSTLVARFSSAGVPNVVITIDFA